MVRRAFYIIICSLFLLVLACQGTPNVVVEDKTHNVSEPLPKAFNPAEVSVEVKQATFSDVRTFIYKLNIIIQSKNYDAWYNSLTEGYIEHYSSPDVLAAISDSPVLKRQGIVLRNLNDYFLYVVYPSRQNDRVDDIDFIDEDNIKAITINNKGERLVLYNLTKSADTWKISTRR